MGASARLHCDEGLLQAGSLHNKYAHEGLTAGGQPRLNYFAVARGSTWQYPGIRRHPPYSCSINETQEMKEQQQPLRRKQPNSPRPARSTASRISRVFHDGSSAKTT